jgi:hypothetical protein
MRSQPETHFDDDGRHVGTVDFDYPGDAAATPSHGAEAFDALRSGLLVILESGHKDGIRTRAAALATLAGLFDSPTAAALAIGLNRSTLHRAVNRLRREIQEAAALCNGSTRKRQRKNKVKRTSAPMVMQPDAHL